MISYLDRRDCMLIDISLRPQEGESVQIPRINLYLVQALIYGLLPRAFATFLHEEGYEAADRRYKLFAFSWLKSPVRPTFTETHIVFQSPVTFSIATPVNATISGVMDGALRNEIVRIGNTPLLCSGVTIREPLAETENISVYTLSPITCYSTLYRKSGEPFTVYHHPEESDFVEQIHTNLVRKHQALFPDSSLPEGKAQITPLGKIREQVALFRPDDPRPIKGWWGRFRLQGPKELLQIALDCGLGAKNSAGFGCVELSKGADLNNRNGR